MSSEDFAKYSFKVVLLGEGQVGKTSIVLRFVHDRFNANHITTIQASFLNKTIHFDNKRVVVNIWDTAGQEIFHSLGPIYYRNAQGAILVYDIGCEHSFVKIQKWIRELKNIVGDDIVCVIVGNKCDLLKREVNYDLKEHEDYAESVGARHFLASAKLNENIDEIFLQISKDMIQKAEQNASNNSSSVNRSNSTRRQLRIEDTSPSVEEALGVGEPANAKCCGR